MSLFVQKFGGTSLQDIPHIKKIADKILKTRKAGHAVVAIVSAMSGETNRLLTLAKKIANKPSCRELDVLLSTGEQVSIALLCMALQEQGCLAKSFTGGQVQILTNDAHSKARIINIDTAQIKKAIESKEVAIIAGFQGVDENGNITTLGRGGSDTTAVAIAAALKADECQIFTDVDGVYTADPRIEPKAKRLDVLTYEEMLEMASLGSKVLQIRSVECARNYNVPLKVLSSFKEGAGTIITGENDNMEQALISGIAHNKDEAKLTLVGIPDQPGIAYQILGPIADANIEVDMILQNVGVHETTDFTFTVHRNDYTLSLEILKKTAIELQAKDLISDQKIAKISIIGVGMRSHAGIASKMFFALAKNNINIKMISTSEIKISVVIDEKYLELAIRILHSTFNLDEN